MARLKGTVEWFDDGKGMGSITPSDGRKPILVLSTSIRSEGVRSLRVGEDVEFVISTDDEGSTWAVDVTGPGEGPVQGSNPGGNGEGSAAAAAGGGGGGVTGPGQGRTPGGGGGGYGGGRGGAGGSQAITCYKCNSSWHAIADCPLLPSKCMFCGGYIGCMGCTCRMRN